MILDEVVAAEPVTGLQTADDPRDAADDVVNQELAIAHGSNTRNERRKCPNDRNKSSDDDRLAAIFLEEAVRAVQMLLVKPMQLTGEHSRTQQFAEVIVSRVSGHGRDDEYECCRPDV